MSAVARAYTFTDGTDAYGSQVENEFTSIFNAWNNHDAGTSKWTVVSTLNASAVPLIADNSSGTNDIVNFKDNGTTVFKIADGGNATLGTGNLIFGTSGKGIVGTTTNDAAATGNVGEIISSAITGGGTNFPTSTNFGDLTSIDVTAGDWELSMNIGFIWVANAITAIQAGIGTASGTVTTGLVEGSNFLGTAAFPTAATDSGLSISSYRVSVASTTTYYLKFQGTFSSTAPKAVGRIVARRMR